MSMSPEDRKTGYVCKPRSKYTKVHSRIERERQKEREKGTLKADSLVKSSPIKIKTRSLFRSRGGRKTRKKKRTRTKRRRKQKGGFDTITINDIYSSIDKDNYEICGEARYNLLVNKIDLYLVNRGDEKSRCRASSMFYRSKLSYCMAYSSKDK